MSSAKQPPGDGGSDGQAAPPGVARFSQRRPTPPRPQGKSDTMGQASQAAQSKAGALLSRALSRTSGSAAQRTSDQAPAVVSNGHAAALPTSRPAQPTARPPRLTARPQPSSTPIEARPVPGAGEPYPALKAVPLPSTSTTTTAAEPKQITPRSPRAALQPEDMPMPPRRSRTVRRPFVIAANAMLTLIVLLIVAGGFAFVIGKQRFDLPGPLAADKVVVIPRGGIRETADLLMREGVIDQPNLFIAGALVLKAQNDLKYGEYKFARNASMHDVVDTLIEGKVVQHAFTVAEGLTSEQIVQRLVDNPTLSGDIREVPREGTLLPETYRFTFGTTREQMIQRMRQAHQRALQEVWERRSADLPIRTPEQLVTLASIVEKETGKPEERTRVAAVFVNRLRQKMKLQSDPTIIYGLVGGKGSLGRPIQRGEIEQPTPYNTYVVDGLPPGPIANPGRASLEAAANPARTKELFFVADGTGGHTFADSYEQHQKNVSRLRSIEQQARSTDPQSALPRTGAASAFAPVTPPPAPPARSHRSR